MRLRGAGRHPGRASSPRRGHRRAHRGRASSYRPAHAGTAAVADHLAAFLTRQLGATASSSKNFARRGPRERLPAPTAVLFGGGVLEVGADRRAARARHPERLARRRAASRARRWLLGSADLDPRGGLAGASLPRLRAPPERGVHGIREAAPRLRLCRSASESSMPRRSACGAAAQGAVPATFGMEGSEAALPAQEFGLVVGEPVRFASSRLLGAPPRDEVSTCSTSGGPTRLQGLGDQTTLPAEAAARRGRAREAAPASPGRHARTRGPCRWTARAGRCVRRAQQRRA